MIDLSLLKTDKQKQEWNFAEGYFRDVLGFDEEALEKIFNETLSKQSNN